MADVDPVQHVVGWAWKQKAGFWVKLAVMVCAVVFGAQSADLVRTVVGTATGIELSEDSATAARQHDLMRLETDAKIDKLGKDLGDKIDQRFDKLGDRIDEILLRGRK